MIWQFGELGYDFSINSNQDGTAVSEEYRTNRKPIRWDYLDNADRKELHDVYARLMTLRNSHPELFDEGVLLEWKVGESDWNDGRSLLLESVTGKRVVVVGNFTQTAIDVDFPAEAGSWNNYFTGEEETVGSMVNVPAHGYKIYTNF